MYDIAWVAVMHNNTYSIGIAERGIKGYSPLNDDNMVTFPTYDAASEEAESRNAHLGLTDQEAFKIVASTMR